jgi:hypothetical protein
MAVNFNRFPDKDPGDRLDYTVDWSEIFDTAEVVFSQTWTVPSGLTKDSDTFSGQLSVATISGGTVDTDYTLTLSVTTDTGSPARIYERDFKLKVRNL